MQLETINGKEYLFDRAHDPESITVLTKELSKIHENYQELILVFSALNDADSVAMTSALFPFFKRIILTKPDNALSAEAETVYRQYNNAHRILAKEETKIILFSRNVPEALHKAQSIAREKSLIVITGSPALVEEALQCLTQKEAPSLNRDTRTMPIV